MNNYISHTKNTEGNEHSLTAHLHEVSRIMTGFANREEYKPLFMLTGFLHDFGKYQPAFQRYLKEGGRRGSVPHASWGAAFAKCFKQYEAAFAIDGHHKGIPDFADLHNFHYTLAVFYETLRLFPEVSLMPRIISESARVGPYDIAQGTSVFVTQPYLNHQVPEPDKFLPGLLLLLLLLFF